MTSSAGLRLKNLLTLVCNSHHQRDNTKVMKPTTSYLVCRKFGKLIWFLTPSELWTADPKHATSFPKKEAEAIVKDFQSFPWNLKSRFWLRKKR